MSGYAAPPHDRLVNDAIERRWALHTGPGGQPIESASSPAWRPERIARLDALEMLYAKVGAETLTDLLGSSAFDGLAGRRACQATPEILIVVDRQDDGLSLAGQWQMSLPRTSSARRS